VAADLLGLVFSWAAPVGWVEMTGGLSVVGLLLYAGSICWVVGYDSIYALQDREDDALVGIRSSALAMGRHVRGGVGAFYAGALFLWAGAIWAVAARSAGAGRAAAEWRRICSGRLPP
jgi:4-hydroxybenzoate polyprenyltransferase